MSIMSDPRITKLPMWARIELGNLIRDLEAARRDLATVAGDTEPTNTVAHAGPDMAIPLPNDTEVEFNLGRRLLADSDGHPVSWMATVRVGVHAGRLMVMTERGGLAVMPRVSNSVDIRVTAL